MDSAYFTPGHHKTLEVLITVVQHCFDNVDCLLFVIGLSEYDQVLREASDVVRLALL